MEDMRFGLEEAEEARGGGGGGGGARGALVQPTLFSYIANDLVWARAGSKGKGAEPFWPVRDKSHITNHNEQKKLFLKPADAANPLGCPVTLHQPDGVLVRVSPTRCCCVFRASMARGYCIESCDARARRRPTSANAFCSRTIRHCVFSQGRMIDVLEAPEGVR
jgi:hypothetical protein